MLSTSLTIIKASSVQWSQRTSYNSADLGSSAFSSSVSSIFVECEEALVRSEEMCPLVEDSEEESSAKCPDKCQQYGSSPQSPDCAYGEICCK